jgi:hypothetical protein
MMPHLGVLSTVYPEAAWEIFDKDCLLRLGTVIAPIGEAGEGESVMDVTLEMPDGETIEKKMKFGEIIKIPLPSRHEAKAKITPHHGFDMGAGHGKTLDVTVEGGVEGIILDARGRPLKIQEESNEMLIDWINTLDLYPADAVKRLEEE